MRDLSCPEVTDRAPGFALDILDPATRAQVAAHLIRCPGCRDTVTQMQDSAAELLDIGPAPDWGGEWDEDCDADPWPDRAAEPSARPGRRRLRTVVTMVAAAVLLVGSTFGPEIEQLATHPEQPSATLVLASSGVAVGTVRIFTGRVQALDVDIRHLAVSGSLEVVVVDQHGTATTLGRVEVARQRGAWLGPEPVAPALLAAVELVGSRGQVALASIA